jgi:predicted nuclease with RNAse H fold
VRWYGGGVPAATTLGIDLAAQNKKTAACLIDWEANRAVVRALVDGPSGEDDQWLLDLAVEASAVGIDAPFGWPEGFVAAVQGWAGGVRWPDAPKRELTFRITDRAVYEAVGRVPLSVSSDRIAVTAWRCVRLLDRLFDGRGSGRSRTGDSDVFEVYPGAALTCWSLDRRGYKKSVDLRHRLLREIRDRARWLDLAAVHDRCVESDDAFDALIASLVTRAASLGLTVGCDSRAEREQPVIAREGWIHLPATSETLEALIR